MIVISNSDFSSSSPATIFAITDKKSKRIVTPCAPTSKKRLSREQEPLDKYLGLHYNNNSGQGNKVIVPHGARKRKEELT